MASSIEIDAPSNASEGDNVPVTVQVTNVSEYHYTFKTEIFADGTLLFSKEETISSGSSRDYPTLFTMPDCNVTILVWVERWSFDHWEYDNSADKVVSLFVAPPVAGTITRMELEYDESRANIPAYDIPQNQRGLVHIWGRNDMSTNQKMGIYWFVADPDGYLVQEYSNWEMFSTGPGSEHEFIAGRFDLSKVGKYTIWVELLMNPDDPEVVDQYIGDLCTVAAVVPEPEFAGFGITEYTK